MRKMLIILEVLLKLEEGKRYSNDEVFKYVKKINRWIKPTFFEQAIDGLVVNKYLVDVEYSGGSISSYVIGNRSELSLYVEGIWALKAKNIKRIYRLLMILFSPFVFGLLIILVSKLF